MDRWNIRYADPDQIEETNLFGESQEMSAFGEAVDNFFRHIVFNGEFLFGKTENFRLRFGYNHLLKRELDVSSFRSFGGFSFGFGFKVNKFHLEYGRGNYHLAGGVNHIGLSLDLKEFYRKI